MKNNQQLQRLLNDFPPADIIMSGLAVEELLQQLLQNWLLYQKGLVEQPIALMPTYRDLELYRRERDRMITDGVIDEDSLRRAVVLLLGRSR